MSALASRAGHNRTLMIFIVSSLVLHVVFVVVVAITMSWGRKPPVPPAAIKTRLVKLGKQRDKKLLPRIEKKKPPPPAKKSPEVVKSKQKVKQPKVDEAAPKMPTPTAKDLLDRFKEDNPEESSSLTDLISKRAKSSDEGHEQGSKLGTEVSGRLKATYNDTLLGIMQGNLEAPNTLTDVERVTLKARVFLRIDADGSLITSKVSKPSPNPLFNNAVLATVRKSAPFPPPPPTVREFYRSGVSVNLCPRSCR